MIVFTKTIKRNYTLFNFFNNVLKNNNIDYYETGMIRTYREKISSDSNYYYIKEYYPTGVILSDMWVLDEHLHKEDGPALITYYENGAANTIHYYINGKLHNLNGPAYINFFKETGGLKKVIYYKNGIEMRESIIINEDGSHTVKKAPTYIEYSPIGPLKYEYILVDGKRVPFNDTERS